MLLSLLCLCTTCNILIGQDHYSRLKINDLRKERANSKDLEKTALILYDICLYYQVKDYQVDSVLHYANVLLQLGDDESYRPASVLGHRMLGSQYTRMSKLQKGRNELYQSISLAKQYDYQRYIHDSYNPMAKNYDQEEQLDSAIHYYRLCISTAPQDLHSKHSYFHTGLSSIYGKLGLHEQEEEQLLLGYERAQKADIDLDKIIALSYLTDYYSSTKIDPVRYNTYRRRYDDLTAGYSKGQSYHSGFVKLENLAPDARIQFLQQSLADNKLRRFLQGVYLNYLQLQTEYLATKQYDAAANVSTEAIAYHDSGNAASLGRLVAIYRNKWLAESHLDNPSMALKTVTQYEKLKDSLTTLNNAKHVNELNIKYKTAQLNAQLATAQVKTTQRTAQRNYALLGTALLLAASIALWLRSKYKQQAASAKNRLQAQQIQNLQHEKKLLSLSSMIEGQEAERKRIAQDLHDGLGGLLSAVRNHFSLIGEEIDKLGKLNIYDRTTEMIDQACHEVRRISHNLMPASLQLNGLIPVIQQYCYEVENSSNITIHFEHGNIADTNIDDNKAIFIYRIILEAVSNVQKHAMASNLLIQLGFYDNELTIVIEDDGKGFDIAEHHDGIGLRSIRSRVDHLSGVIEVDSKLGQGTTLTINIPHED